jgi:hypothetical protein
MASLLVTLPDQLLVCRRLGPKADLDFHSVLVNLLSFRNALRGAGAVQGVERPAQLRARAAVWLASKSAACFSVPLFKPCFVPSCQAGQLHGHDQLCQ